VTSQLRSPAFSSPHPNKFCLLSHLLPLLSSLFNQEIGLLCQVTAAIENFLKNTPLDACFSNVSAYPNEPRVKPDFGVVYNDLS